MKWERGDLRRGMTLVEVLIVIAVLAVLAGVLLPALSKARERSKRSYCLNHLMQVSLSTRQWGLDHTNLFPTGLSTDFGGTKEYAETGKLFRLFQAMSNDLNTPFILTCPTDTRRPAKDFATLSNTNISYFVGLDASELYPSMILAGDRNVTNGTLLPNGILELTSNSVVGWTHEMHNEQGNIALSDGSVHAFNSSKLREGLTQTGVATNRLVMPVD